ncbi:CdaR family protein [Planomicrobium okeanokoites]|uniref:CdaR family protein n=1 Tax=Planomicrobium okeanokoites TaxID=244 RepID=UPI0024920C61|nr:CdaR family protein [Planomicrobium okeanokoites]
MDKMMDNPWFLRITALLLAFLMFFSVKAEEENNNSAASNTMTEIIEDVPLEVYYDDTSLMVSGVPATVDVQITGPTREVQTTQQIKDFTVFVDLRNLPLGEHRIRVQTENISQELGVRIDPTFLDVLIEERVTQEFKIDAELNERLIAENYVLKSITADPNTVTVSGPKSVIDSISFVKATVTEEPGLDSSVTREARVRVLANDLTKLDNVTIEPEVVEVEAVIEEYSREVPISLTQTGTAREGITVDEIETDVDTVKISGPRNIVDTIEEYEVEVNISGVTLTDTAIEVDLAAPEGTSAVEPGSIIVDAEISVDETVLMPEDINFNNANPDEALHQQIFENLPLEIRGLEDGNKADFLDPEDGLVSLIAYGTEELLDSLKLEDFVVYVDAAEKKGQHKLEVGAEGLKKAKWLTFPSTATIHIQ